jgi:hypothetical protein
VGLVGEVLTWQGHPNGWKSTAQTVPAAQSLVRLGGGFHHHRAGLYKPRFMLSQSLVRFGAEFH